MNESEDQKLTERIRDVFENFEDPEADLGWQELRKSYPLSVQRPLLFWISSLAALLLLIAGLWFWNYSGDEEITLSKQKHVPALQDSAQSDSPVSDTNINQEVVAENPENSKISPNKIVLNQPKLPLTSANEDTSGVQQVRIKQNTKPETSTQNLNFSNSNQNAVNSDSAPAKLAEKPSVQDVEALPIAKAEIPVQETPVSILAPRDSSVFGISASSVAAITTESKLNSGAVEPIDLTVKRSDKKLSWAIVGGSYFNFAEGSESALNFSAGLGSEIRLSRKLKLSTGISLAKNSLYYDQGVPTSKNLDFFSAPNSGQISNGSINTASDYSAELVNLDIPINLTYSAGRKGFFVSGGLSSGTYLSEKYAVGYRTFNLASNSYSSNSSDQVKKWFSEFDLAKTLNFSFGMKLPFGRQQNLTIEPFLKYPLQGLGSQDLKFGASGLNLRLNFNKHTE